MLSSGVVPPLQGKEIKKKLRSLSREASLIDPNLAKRLDEIYRWIKNVKPGSLVAKKFVVAFLLQVIQDARIWLLLQSLPSQEEKECALGQMNPTEKYWYGDLFPRWLQENDPKFYIWKQKMMSGEFNQDDADVIRAIAQKITHRGGTFWHCFVADLSMGTDLIVSHRCSQPLCLQITSVSDKFVQQKYENWKRNLQLWQIERGLFSSYDPSQSDFVNQLVNLALFNSDHLRTGTYLKFP